MSNSKTIEIDWVDKQFQFLTSRIGIYKLGDPEFFFEPTPGFYGFISQGKTEVLNEAIKILADFIGLSTAPIIEPWKNSENPLTSSEYDFTNDKTAPGFIRYNGPYHSRIELNITNKYSPFVMGAILAHELTHYYLGTKNIWLTNTEENERMTDLATAYLGLGKLTLNGYSPITWEAYRKNRRVEYTYQVGYLNQYDMALIHFKIAKFRSINLNELMKNLTDNSCSEVKKAVSELYVYDDLAFNLSNKFCYKCGKNRKFDYSEMDKKLYCSVCGWEYNAATRIAAGSQKSFFSKVKKIFGLRKK